MRKRKSGSRIKGFLKPLSDITQALTDPLLDGQGFLSGSIIKDWAVIVGESYKDTARPEKVSFPRGKNTGGTLYIGVESSGVALLIEHSKLDILNRINTYYGYEAMKGLRIKVSPREHSVIPRKVKPLAPEEVDALEQEVADVQDEELRSVLLRLGLSIALNNNNKREKK